MLAMPMTAPMGKAQAMLGATARASMVTPKAKDALTTSITPIDRRRAVHRAPTSEPRLMQEKRMVKVAFDRSKVRVTSSGRTTWKLKDRVPTTAIIASGHGEHGGVPDVAQALAHLALAPDGRRRRAQLLGAHQPEADEHGDVGERRRPRRPSRSPRW